MFSWRLLFFMVVFRAQKFSAGCSVDGPAAASSNASLTLLKADVMNDPMAPVCLDGTPGAYYHSPGDGAGVDNWLIFIEGGGWCSSAEECKSRATYALGSTNNSLPSMSFGHILSPNANGNPDFCNWNRIYVRYCDGSSFTSGVQGADPRTNVTYRGAMIFRAIMEDLLAKGMSNAKNAILSGSSVGGLAVIIHCDRFRSFLPASARVKCLADSAYFLHPENLIGDKLFDTTFEGLVNLQCFFPQYILQTVETPLFIVMSSFDLIQIKFNLSPEHESCLLNKNCTLDDELAMIEGLRLDLLASLPIASPSSSRGMWITSCMTHELTVYSWIAPILLKIDGNRTYPQVFGDWFYDRRATQVIDMSPEAKNCTQYGIHIKQY
ncbi:unnamed protein product [Cuscuta campestris]|uniref:Pectin acetylesterase n=1 Tax=Cuscuta campestris TaxID=132261 RepID=A0A484N7E7_9ASTE|nr:unnamed protein product [Cuscuta campestris]